MLFRAAIRRELEQVLEIQERTSGAQPQGILARSMSASISGAQRLGSREIRQNLQQIYQQLIAIFATTMFGPQGIMLPNAIMMDEGK
jgi:hypothetical protein